MLRLSRAFAHGQALRNVAKEVGDLPTTDAQVRTLADGGRQIREVIGRLDPHTSTTYKDLINLEEKLTLKEEALVRKAEALRTDAAVRAKEKRDEAIKRADAQAKVLIDAGKQIKRTINSMYKKSNLSS